MEDSNIAFSKVSIVIPCRNSAGTIADQLDALSKQHCDWPWEIVISDNGSADQTLEIVREFAGRLPSLVIVDSSAARGAAHARNVGVQAASGDAILFCDADDEVGEGWLEAMSRALVGHDFVAARLDTEKLNERWVRDSWHNSQLNGLATWRGRGINLQFAGAGSLGIKRCRHEEVGGFDEKLLGLEDVDYCWKVQLAGCPLVFVPDAVVHYRYRGDLYSMFTQMRLAGKQYVDLYKKYQESGLMNTPTQPFRKMVIRWFHLILRLPKARSKAKRARWVRNLGSRVGRLQGSIKNRTLVP